MSAATDRAYNKGRALLVTLMHDTAYITVLGAPSVSDYGDFANGTNPATSQELCSISPALDGLPSESILGQKLKGRRGWLVKLPYGTEVYRTNGLRVVTREGGDFNLEILDVRGQESNAMEVRLICAEIVPSGAVA